MVPSVLPMLVANNGTAALRAAIQDPDRYACEPKIDGVRGLVVYGQDGLLETRNRNGVRRDWLRGDGFESGLRRLAARLPFLLEGTVLDGELTTGRFQMTMAALFGAKAHRADLRFVVFDVPILAGVAFGRCLGMSGVSDSNWSLRPSTYRWSSRLSSTQLGASRSTWLTAASKASS